MAEDEFAFFVPEVHAATLAETPVLAGGAIVLFHPVPVAVGLKAVVPYIHEVVCIDIALVIIGADAGAGRYGAVRQHTRNAHAGIAEEEIVADVALVIAQEALTAIAGLDAAFLAGGLDEFHEALELDGGELQLGILRAAAHGEHREQPPLLEAASQEEFLDLFQVREVPLVHAGNYVKDKAGHRAGHADGLFGPFKGAGDAAHPVVVFFQAVQAHGHGAQPGGQQAHEALLGHGKTIGDHPPGKFAVMEGLAAFFQVRPQERFPAGDHNHDLMGVQPGGLHLVQHLQEVFQRHVLEPGGNFAVAAAVAAVKVATQGALPEDFPELMFLNGFGGHLFMQPQRYMMS